ncbi:MAG TPA: DUF6377 domain-containing protein [Lacibacter sp.]|nr:DUF6377 domain-containing protein [Lacibacter sp.]HMO89851.1 DUF6377 domain-containing protein [Lacibacter sp.]
MTLSYIYYKSFTKSGSFILIFVFLCFAQPKAQNNSDSLLNYLDKVIMNKQVYSTLKEHRLDSIKSLILLSNSPYQKAGYYRQLFLEYEHFNLDGALRAAKEKRAIALQIDSKDLLVEADMNMAQILGKLGMYKEAFEILEKINRNEINPDALQHYYHIYHSTYLLLYESAFSEEERFKYNSMIRAYKDTLLSTFDTTSSGFKLVLAGKYLQDEKADLALAITLEAYNKAVNLKEKSNLFYSLSIAYEGVRDVEKQKLYLIKASVRDIEYANKSYIALRKLAVILYQQGDLERAYTYIRCAMEDAHFAKARFRMLEISETLPIITASYDKKMQSDKRKLSFYLISISVLTGLLFILIIFIFRQLKKISAAEAFVKIKNEELGQMNQKLIALNEKLSEADNVKQVYIGYVFRLYSSFIDKLEEYRLNLHKKIRNQQFDDALKITSSANLFNLELKEFFQNFDAIFLGIFPKFLEDFNEMLKPEEQIIPKAGDILTPELRVFALIRLGISDSGKIAELLHYSPQTIYNYKLKIKNKLKVPKEEFYTLLQQIGR